MRWVITRPDGQSEPLSMPQGHLSLPKNWTRGAEPRRWLSVIGETADLSKADRLAIYGEGYFLRIVDCLANIFVSVRNIVGEHEFDHHLGRDFLVKHPSVHRCIDNVGKEFADFMKKRPETKDFPFLPDLARLEWAYHETFYADEREDFDFASLKDVPVEKWAAATVDIDGSVHLLTAAYPIEPVWRDDGRWARRRLKAIKAKKSHILIFRRPDAQVRVAPIEPAAHLLLTMLADGRTFGAALQAASRKSAAAPDKVMTWFRTWADLGILRGVRFR
jgi:hypothetical protein